jgi:hypothetical protein
MPLLERLRESACSTVAGGGDLMYLGICSARYAAAVVGTHRTRSSSFGSRPRKITKTQSSRCQVYVARKLQKVRPIDLRTKTCSLLFPRDPGNVILLTAVNDVVSPAESVSVQQSPKPEKMHRGGIEPATRWLRVICSAIERKKETSENSSSPGCCSR